MANADRISEVYKGELWEVAVQRRARERIHWLCRQAHGLVLDLGCSQGIASLLLARDGLRAVGVDIELPCLEYAERDRLDEPDPVARRVSFVGADGAQLPFPDDCFDSVLLGEVLEHLVNPVFILKEVARVLRPEGTVAITVPFGYHPHHDHKATFYPHSLLELVASHFTPVELEVEAGYMRLISTSYSDDAQPAAERLTLQRQQDIERAFLETEESSGGARKRLQDLERQLKTVRDTHRETQRELERIVTKWEQADQQVGHLRSLNRDQERLFRQEQQTSAALRKRIEKLHQDHNKLLNRLQLADWKLSSLRARKWWRIGRAFRDALRKPWRILILPVELPKIALERSSLPPRPEPTPLESALETPPSNSGDTRRSDRGEQRTVRTSRPPAHTRDTWSSNAHLGVVGRSELQWPPGIRSVPRAPSQLWVASIMDEMSSACFGPECHLISFRPDNWRDVLSEVRPHFLFVESAWVGNQGSWQYKVASYTHPDSVGLPDLKALVEWCHDRDIPTVFWNKEDPVHFDRFKEAAQLFDFVFTSDADCVPRYQQLAGIRAELVDSLPFAAQPKLHNPISPAEPRKDQPCFAGTYYRTRHVERRQQLEMLLDAARPFGLVIYDRNHGLESKEFGFPDRFQPHIVGRLPYEELVRVYTRHKVFLNANSVTESPTMFSRRVFELLASGTAVVSTPSEGMSQIFGDLVPVATTEEMARGAIQRLIEDDPYRRSLTMAATRLVLSEHTYRERLAFIATTIGLDIDPKRAERFSLIVLVDRTDGWARLVEELRSQTRQPDELLVGSGTPGAGHAFGEALAGHWTGTAIRVIDQESQSEERGKRYRALAALAAHQWVAVMDPAHSYGAAFLGDLVLATKYTDADVIGKASSVGVGSGRPDPNSPIENQFVDAVHALACLVRRELLSGGPLWPTDSETAARVMPGWCAEGMRLYATHAEDFTAEPRWSAAFSSAGSATSLDKTASG